MPDMPHLDDLPTQGETFFHYGPCRKEAAATFMGQTEAHEHKAASIDLNFITVLANDPHRALEYARNMDEVNQAKSAIQELEKVSQYPVNQTKKATRTKLIKILFTIQAKAAAKQATAPKATIDLSNDEPTRAIAIPAPTKPRESGFTPSSAR